MDIELNILQNWIQESDNSVFISGADLSAEAGFPDYRIMTQADWARYKYAPDEILRLTFLQRNPFYFYRYYREKILAPVLTAQPSPAHEALAHLEQAGKLRAILTVNIDGIHQEAGSREVLELHGSVMRSWCAKCEKFLDFFYIADSPTHIPYCNVDMCGDYVRPAIVLKEEPYDLALLEKALDYVKEFLEIREGHPELYKEARENNQIGIPVFVLEDGTVTMDCDAAFEAARRAKKPAVVMVGSHLCKACRNRLAELKEEGLPVEFHDIVENLNDMRLYLRIRENHPELYDEIRKEGRVGIPVFILPDGTVTNDFEAAREAARSLK